MRAAPGAHPAPAPHPEGLDGAVRPTESPGAAGVGLTMPSGTHSAEAPAPRRRIVVGVDGSSGAAVAVQWAAEEALRRGVALEAVAVWDVAPCVGPAWLRSVVADGPRRDGPEADRLARELAEEAHDVLRTALVPVLAEHPGLRPEHVVVRGKAGRTLVDVARHAELLVLGAPRPAPGPPAPGSVAAWCAAHAPCPVVVVRAASPA